MDYLRYTQIDNQIQIIETCWPMELFFGCKFSLLNLQHALTIIRLMLVILIDNGKTLFSLHIKDVYFIKSN